jgi:ribosome-binding factor A
MAANRNERLKGMLRDMAAEFVAREAGRQSLVTVTDVAISPNEKEVTIFVTVLPVEKEQAALDFLNRQARDLRHYFKEHSKLRALPFPVFMIDFGEKNRQRIDELSRM